ncbi:hypothetical protein WA158_003046 [Blastocystis sp. Blastoise]
MSEDLNNLVYSKLLKENNLSKKLELLKWNMKEPYNNNIDDYIFNIRQTVDYIKELNTYLFDTLYMYDNILNDENAKKAAPEHLALIDYSADNRKLHKFIVKQIHEEFSDIESNLQFIEFSIHGMYDPEALFKQMKRIRKEKYDECEKFVKYNISKNGIDTPPKTPTHEAKRTKIEPSQPERNLTPLVTFSSLNLDCISESEDTTTNSDKE